MDDPPDRGYSRAPEVRDLAALCRPLNRGNVRYVDAPVAIKKLFILTKDTVHHGARPASPSRAR
jgi:hypothetical protein